MVTLGRVIDETLLETIDKMDKAVAHVQSQFQTVRTGRAAPALVERLTVDYYGTQVPVVQLATIQVPEARQLLVRPHDRTTLASIEKAIRDSDLGVAPGNDGSTIRLSFPPLTEERRKDLAKQVRAKVEEARIAIRNVRRDVHDHLRKIEHDHDISQDELHRSETELQKITDDHIASVDQLGEEKEQEVLTI